MDTNIPDENSEEFSIPPKPLSPLTPERLKSLQDLADKKLLDMYEAMVSASAHKKV